MLPSNEGSWHAEGTELFYHVWMSNEPAVHSENDRQTNIQADSSELMLHADRTSDITEHGHKRTNLTFQTRLCSESKATNLNRKWSGIQIGISGLIWIRIRMSTGSIPKCCGFVYLVGISHFAGCHENRPMTVWEMLINFLNSPILQWWGKWKSDTESVSRTESIVLPTSRPSHNTKFQRNKLIT